MKQLSSWSLVLLFACGAPGPGTNNNPATGSQTSLPLGNWKVTSLTGDITLIGGGVCPENSVHKPDPASGWNEIRVKFDGTVEWYFGFKGAPGGTHPDSLNIAGQGKAQGSQVTGNHVREDLGSTDTLQASFDGNTLSGTWSTSQTLSGDCSMQMSGMGSFVATPP